ncbi:MAG: hypothetical protein PVH88_24920 [Ignavibacteria bacterium]|jgi:hypothetical protein
MGKKKGHPHSEQGIDEIMKNMKQQLDELVSSTTKKAVKELQKNIEDSIAKAHDKLKGIHENKKEE